MWLKSLKGFNQEYKIETGHEISNLEKSQFWNFCVDVLTLSPTTKIELNQNQKFRKLDLTENPIVYVLKVHNWEYKTKNRLWDFRYEEVTILKFVRTLWCIDIISYYKIQIESKPEFRKLDLEGESSGIWFVRTQSRIQDWNRIWLWRCHSSGISAQPVIHCIDIISHYKNLGWVKTRNFENYTWRRIQLYMIWNDLIENTRLK